MVEDDVKLQRKERTESHFSQSTRIFSILQLSSSGAS